MIESDELIRFSKRMEPDTSRRDAEHKTLADQVAEYLAQGGAIQQIDNGVCVDHHYPIRRTREAQINFVRRKTWLRLNNRK
jgi:hypothetical protein